MSVVLFTDGSAMCLYSYIRVIHDILWHDAEYYTWKNEGIRFFFFWNTRLENYCSSELDTAIGSPLGQVLEMVDRISFKIYIECRDFFFFFVAYWVQLRKRNLCDLLLVLLTNSPSPLLFFRFIQFILLCVEVVLFN